MVLENNNNANKRPQAKIRRNSTGNLDFSASPPQPLPLPNYLRASMGSCHDFCKYGGIKPPESTQKPTTTTPLPKKPPLLPDKTSKLAHKSQNVVNVIKNSTSNVTMIQQKMKQKKAIIPNHPNDLKLKPLAKEVSSSSIMPVQSPSRRRNSDVYGHTHSIKNGSNHKVVCVTATASQSGKRGVSRNASKKDLSQCGNKPRKAKTEPCFEIPVEKILYIDEMTPCKEADDHFLIQKLSSEETNDKAIDLIDDRFSLSLSSLSEDNINCGSTTGSSCSDTLASISITSCETDSDISSNMLKSKRGNCEDEASISITSFKTDSGISSNMLNSNKGNCVDEVSISITSFKTDSDISSNMLNSKKGNCVDETSISITSCETDSDNSSNMYKSKKGNCVFNASISVTSCETHSDISSNTLKPKKVISVDDDCKSTETRNESIQVVVLQHQNQEEKKLVSKNLYNDVIGEAARNLVEAGKVKALVSAFEAVISLEDNMSLRTLKA